MSTICKYYFRVRENGAALFHVSYAEKPKRRIEMDLDRRCDIRNGEIKATGRPCWLSDGDIRRYPQWE